MSVAQNRRDKLLQMAQDRGIELDESSLLLFDELQAQDGATMSAELTKSPTTSNDWVPPSSLSARSLDITILQVAITDTYVIKELDVQSGESLESLLRCSDRVLIGGRRRLRLQSRARALILASLDQVPHGRRFYEELLSTATALDRQDAEAVNRDPVRCANAWVRQWLTSDSPDFTNAPVHQLRGAMQAADDLQLVSPHFMHKTRELRNLLQMAEMLEPMRLLVGSSGGWGGKPPRDRFVGREKELAELRSHVDVLDSQSIKESVSRTLNRLTKRARGGVHPGVLMLQGRGGMGKSTLLAKFVLDHVRSPSSPILLIYLDFDSASLRPCTPLRLLLETVRQMRFQAPEVGIKLAPVEAEISQALLLGQSDDRKNWWSDVRNALRAHAKGSAMLLVLDTMEAVQATPDMLDQVIGFIDRLEAKDFPQLRIVAAGRAEVPALIAPGLLRAKGSTLSLTPLSVTDARKMAEELGRDHLGEDWDSSWNADIVGSGRSNDARREPLSVRIAVELLCAELESRRDILAGQIAELGAESKDGFVGALYRRRILAHIRDPEARKLVWPGLVFRRINLALVYDVLAPLCGLDVAHLKKTYDTLAREVWIVVPDGDGLRHLEDLRSRTLPLMREQDPKLFRRVNEAAIEHFRNRQFEDARARAEWIYHRLLADERTDSVQDNWSEDMASLLSGAEQDFPPDSDTAQFLLVRTTRRALAPERILRLSPLRQIEHIARCWPDLAKLDEEKMVPLLAKLELDAPEFEAIPSGLRNVYFALMVKTGRWERAGEFDPNVDTWREQAHAALSHLLGRSSLVADWHSWSDVIRYDRGSDRHSLMQECERFCRYIIASPRYAQDEFLPELDKELASALNRLQEISIDRFDTVPLSLQNLLRPVAAKTQASLRPALRLLLSCQRLRRDRSYCLEEIRGLIGSMEGGRLGVALKSADPYLAQWISPSFAGMPLRVDDAACVAAIDDHIDQLVSAPQPFSGSAPSDDRALRLFAAARHPDCIVPLAYAATRAMRARIPPEAEERAFGYTQQPKQDWWSKLFTRRAGVDNVMTALRLADEAGDLLAMADVFSKRAEDKVAGEDLGQMVYWLRLRRAPIK